MLQDAIIETLRRKRNFTNASDCIDTINKRLSKTMMPEIVKNFHIFDGSYKSMNMKFAISVVIGNPRKDTRDTVSYILSEMEKLEAQNEITGGLVIYITTRHSEWEHNNCITLGLDCDYFGTPVHLTGKAGDYVDEWDEDYGALNARRRYALFHTKGARNRIVD